MSFCLNFEVKECSIFGKHFQKFSFSIAQNGSYYKTLQFKIAPQCNGVWEKIGSWMSLAKEVYLSTKRLTFDLLFLLENRRKYRISDISHCLLCSVYALFLHLLSFCQVSVKTLSIGLIYSKVVLAWIIPSCYQKRCNRPQYEISVHKKSVDMIL